MARGENMASLPSSFYANRDNYNLSLDASNRRVAMTQEITSSLSSESCRMIQIPQPGFYGAARSIGETGAIMDYGFASLNDDAVEQSARSVCAELREINKTLNMPLQAQALELYTMAQEYYGKKLYENDRDKLRQSIDRHNSYYLSWFLLGEVYLDSGEYRPAAAGLDEAVKALTEAAKWYVTLLV
jgi:tetratricopeptide (TPR) repeat protein